MTGLVSQTLLSAAAPVDFDREIRPLLSKHCFQCHGFDGQKRQADLRLDTATGMAGKVASGRRVVVAGKPTVSELYLRVTSRDADLRMPPPEVADGLTVEEADRLRRWIEEGAGWAEHWAFVPPQQTPLPIGEPSGWRRNGIDAFVLTRLNEVNLRPSAEAGREALLRRVMLDLRGLPPSLAEIEIFQRDGAPDAYERMVDRALAGPHYGERMARLWLDLARYADSSGYANDRLRSIWPYRDWVIDAFNTDMPFDQFTLEQLAGDLLPGATQSQIVASGFHRNTPHQYEGGSDPEQYRVERVKNRLDTTGTVWLGLTVGCAQCHTHKFDPISQTEYYQLYAFFNSANETKHSVASESQQVEISRLVVEIGQLNESLKKAATASEEAKELKRRLETRTKALDQLRKSLPTTLVFREAAQKRVTHVHLRGDFLVPGQAVVPGTLARLHPFSPPASGVPTRVDLARWIMSADNPLTARVTTNRFWQHFFGQGLVETENDFGHRGASPTHPELLDWLAHTWSSGGFSLKRLHRLILASATYRQDSSERAELVAADPFNRRLGRQSRHRVEGEIIRDMALSVSGRLSRKMGGKSVFPPIPANVIGTSSARHKWPTSGGEDRFRRGLYTAVYRANVYPMLSTFDGPDRDNACTKRTRSNTPLQSLSLANDPAMSELFRGLAERLLHVTADSDSDRLVYGFRLCLGRHPSEPELDRLLAFCTHERRLFAGDPEAARTLAGTTPLAGASREEFAVWYAVARLFFNLDEFVTRE
ncbi:MAG: PSD1 and planctomycete cytochrome C domain-containing protein [Planctomycetota bacterium]|nr:PSD1 and planctomycete cytochrome C domain-containing protein [Planctomycetota bacterium]